MVNVARNNAQHAPAAQVRRHVLAELAKGRVAHRAARHTATTDPLNDATHQRVPAHHTQLALRSEPVQVPVQARVPAAAQ